MIKIKIGTSEANYKQINSDWVTQQIEKRKREGKSFWVEVIIEKGDVNINFSTPGRNSSRGVQRPLTFEERRIQKLWKKYNLDRKDFSIPDLLYFLSEIENLS